MIDLQDAKEAATHMANHEEAVATYRHMDSLLTKVPDVPARLSEGHAWANPLLRLQASDPITYQTIIAWVDRKRQERGLTPLFSLDVEFDKTEYMREYMANKRARERRAVDLENKHRAERDKLAGVTRHAFLKKLTADWLTKRDTLLDKMRTARGRRLTKEELQGALTQFWAAVDDELEAAERRR